MTTDITFDIEPLGLTDIVPLIDCVKRCYGESYPNPVMYDPAQLKEVIDSKLMHSVITKLPSGEVIGHCALTFDGPQNTSPEAGKMMVDPNYRGHQIAEKMAQKRIEIAQSLALPGFWTECVTNHPYSQHEMIAFNAKETGLFIGDMPSTIAMKGLENHPDTRMSLLAFYLPIRDRPHTIYLSNNHTTHTQVLAQDLSLDRKIMVSNQAGRGQTIINTVVNSGIQTANIFVEIIGSDFLQAVVSQLKSIQTLNLASIYLDLPIEQEAASMVFEDLEKCGFFWGSWMPNYSNKGDVVRLQKINQTVNVDEIVCARPQGDNIKNYVVSEWKRTQKSA
jgi:RimJ/RimL family protein N-acetyltransferase